MIGDLDISGVFLPTLLVLMGITYVLYLVVHGLLTRVHFYRLVWHRALFNVGLYALLLAAVDSLSRYLMT
ncbi:MAG: Protein AaeX [Pseudomonas sp.]|nr:MAG: Protein AaeX [Pseudomonas sp.]